MKILVTGACGFVGREIVRGLSSQGWLDVVGIYRNGMPEFGLSRVRWTQCDILNGIHLNENFDYIIHCAAHQDVQNFPVRTFIDTNLAMTENVASFGVSAGVSGIIFTSSVELHGKVIADFIDEKSESINPSLYGISKVLCEHLLQEYVGNFPVISLRLCGVVGAEAKNIWLSKVLKHAFAGENIEIYNANRYFNNIVHVDDLVDLMVSLISNGFSGFNAFPVASEKPILVRSVVAEILSLTNSLSQVIEKNNLRNSFMISNKMAMDLFGFAPSGVVANVRKYVLNSSIRV